MSEARRLGPVLLSVGVATSALAAATHPEAARSAASQDWPAFVLVGGLILVGAVASEAGLFAKAGRGLARMPGEETTRFVYSAALIGLVSALLNLDTSAAFLTPVLVQMARTRKQGEDLLLYGCLLLTNAGSLLLPGSNLTNLIVTGHLHLAATTFAEHMAPAWAFSLVITALVIAVAHRGDLHPAIQSTTGQSTTAQSTTAQITAADLSNDTHDGKPWFSAAVVIAALVLVVCLRNAALEVMGVGLAATAVEILRKRTRLRAAANALDLPVLAGLFGIAVALGTLGRAWDVPARLLGHLGSFATAGFAAVASVTFNNLPAASLLAARVPPHPYSLLVGLDLGPNLFVTGSLSAFLWFRAARQAGAHPSVRHASGLGIVAAPLAIAGAVGVLALGSLH